MAFERRRGRAPCCPFSTDVSLMRTHFPPTGHCEERSDVAIPLPSVDTPNHSPIGTLLLNQLSWFLQYSPPVELNRVTSTCRSGAQAAAGPLGRARFDHGDHRGLLNRPDLLPGMNQYRAVWSKRVTVCDVCP